MIATLRGVRRVLTGLLSLIALIALLAAGGCGGGDDDSAKKPAEPAKTATGPDPEDVAEAEEEDRSDENEDTGPTDRELREERQQDREDDSKFDERFKKFDEQFEETPFQKLTAKLPIGEPPLYVEQYISTEGSHEVYTAVERERFLCEWSPARRKKAVEEFYRAADEVMRAGGVEDFVQVVTVTSETTQQLPALATARDGSVALSSLGGGRSGC